MLPSGRKSLYYRVPLKNKDSDMKDCFKFTDDRDICIGVGRIVWARELHYDGFHPKFEGRTLSEGWVLPGGERTKDRSVAEAAAKAINSVKYVTQQSKRRIGA
jgi:hypothetical protein